MGIAYLTGPKYQIAMTIGFGCTGNEKKQDGYYYSSSECEVGCSSYIVFGSDYRTTAQGATHVDCDIIVDSNNTVATAKRNTGNWNLSNICNKGGGCSVVPLLSTSFSGGAVDLFSYAGLPVSIFIRPYDSKDWYVFYVKPCVVNNGVIDTSQLGQLWYCGINTPATDDGILIYTINSVSGNTVNFSGHNIDNDLPVIMWKQSSNCPGFEIQTADDTEIYASVDGTMPDFDGDDDDDDVCNCYDVSKSCYADIESCCNDDQFTSDLNEFSSIVCPDTYINPDTGEEERLPWNGLMHLCRTIQIIAKVFYALVFRLFDITHCQINCFLSKIDDLNDNLKKLKDTLSEKEMSVDVSVEDKHNVIAEITNGRVQDYDFDEESGGFWNG